MKITKIKTDLGSVVSCTSSRIDSIVSKMRSESNVNAVERVASASLAMSINGEDNIHSGNLDGADALPYLIFSTVYGKEGAGHPKYFTKLLLLSIKCNGGNREISAIKDKLRQMPCTFLIFRGSSKRTLKLVVRCEYGDGSEPRDMDDYTAFLKASQEVAAKYYSAFCGCDVEVREQSPAIGCRMSYDPDLYYNPDAQPMTVARQSSDVISQYHNVSVDSDGFVSTAPSFEDREKEMRDYYTCLNKALSENDDDEAVVLALADNCHKAFLPEEASVVRTVRMSRIHIGEDAVRKIFRSVYAKPYTGKRQSPMNKQESIARFVEEFFNRRYQLRYNVMKQMEEFRRNDGRFGAWMQLTDRELRSIVHEQMKEGGPGWSVDMATYVRSSMAEDYNPILEFLSGVGEWNHKTDYIGGYACRVDTDFDKWPDFFHRWFLAMVAQWLNRSRDFGNMVVPMLIGGQGTFKSTFCKQILPPSLREYYIDDIKMDNPEQAERVLCRMALVNIDEYNAKTDREQAKIKRILQEKDVQLRRIRSDQYTSATRMASFVATTNETHPLTDPSGSRRYICCNVNGKIDTSSPVNYQQMYAQAMAEIREGGICYFTKDEEREIIAHNRLFERFSSDDDVVMSFFKPAERGKDNFMRAIDMQQVLSQHLKSADVPTMKKLTEALRRNRFGHGAINGVAGWYAQRIDTHNVG